MHLTLGIKKTLRTIDACPKSVAVEIRPHERSSYSCEAQGCWLWCGGGFWSEAEAAQTDHATAVSRCRSRRSASVSKYYCSHRAEACVCRHRNYSICYSLLFILAVWYSHCYAHVLVFVKCRGFASHRGGADRSGSSRSHGPWATSP